MSLMTDSGKPDQKAYRYLLMRTSDSLSSRDLVTIKFLCNDIVGASRMEKINNGIGVWTELENRSLISADDHYLLVELLYHADRFDLIRQLTNTDAASIRSMLESGQNTIGSYRIFLSNFCKEIPQRDLETIKYLFMEEISSSARENAKDMWAFMQQLERIMLLSPSNMECLIEICNAINRSDLLSKISTYKASIPCSEADDKMPYNESKLLDSDDDEMLELRSPYSLQHGEDYSGYSHSLHASEGSQEKVTSPIQATDDFTGFNQSQQGSSGSSYVNVDKINYPENGPIPYPEAGPIPYPEAGPIPYPEAGPIHYPEAGPIHYLETGPNLLAVTANFSNLLHSTHSSSHTSQFNEEEQVGTPSLLHQDLNIAPSSGNMTESNDRMTSLTEGSVKQAWAEAEENSSVDLNSDDEQLLSLCELPSYKMTAIPRGYCLIINNEQFTYNKHDKQCKKLENRPGSSVDADNLQQLFGRLGFQVVPYKNCSAEKMNKIFTVLRTPGNLENHDALVVCVLSHGKLGVVYDSNGYEVKISDIVCHFKPEKCPALLGKPKIFFIQACQGKSKQKSTASGGKLHTDDDDGDELPLDADFFIGYATVPGYVSYRHEDDGSWYINTLVKRIEKYCSKYDLLSIMTEVNRGVANHSASEKDGVYKQMPLPYSTLTKKIFLPLLK